jgi:hypothetical protein
MTGNQSSFWSNADGTPYQAYPQTTETWDRYGEGPKYSSGYGLPQGMEVGMWGGNIPLASVMGEGLMAPFATGFSRPSGTDDPGYGFAVGQGQEAIEKSAAARGNLLSGGTLKELSKYTAGQALQSYNDTVRSRFDEYVNAGNMFNQNKMNQYNMLMGLAQQGYGASTGIANAQMGGTMGAANARAAGQAGAGRAWSGALTGVGNTIGGTYAQYAGSRPSGYADPAQYPAMAPPRPPPRGGWQPSQPRGPQEPTFGR